MTDGAPVPTGPGPAVLVCEDGRTFRGQAYGAPGRALGEAVFATGMTGYQETLTDPSYHRQIVLQTAPHIGNTGWNDEDGESGRIWVAGYAVRDPARRPSSWRSTRSLDTELARQGVVGIAGIDTRALTRHLRSAGAMRAGIFSGDALRPVPELLDDVLRSPPMTGADLTAEVTTRAPYLVPAEGTAELTVAALDLGIKASTPRLMAARGIATHVLPATSTVDDVLAVAPDGVFLSNGPGDPATADRVVALTRELLRRRLPLFGICFGNQVLGRALGFGTYKLRFGHRGINQPVLDLRSGRVEITAHNHGFAVDAPVGDLGAAGPGPDGGGAGASSGAVAPVETEFGRVEVSHVCLNDGVVEGLRCLDLPAFSVQYHPEAAAGPHDAGHLFDRFRQLMKGNR